MASIFVEIDETHICTRKYNRGCILLSEQEWVLGGICRQTKETFLIRVPDRSRDTLLPIILNYVNRNSIIVTDSARVYQCLESCGFTAHFSICHKKYFVHPKHKAVHTNTIERQWRSLKTYVKSFKSEMVDTYISQFLYFECFFKDKNGKYIKDRGYRMKVFLNHVREVYPGPGKTGLQLRTAQKVIEENTSKKARQEISNSREKDNDETINLINEDKVFLTEKEKICDTDENSSIYFKTKALVSLRSIFRSREFNSLSGICENIKLYKKEIEEMISFMRRTPPHLFSAEYYKLNKSAEEILHPSFLTNYIPVEVDGDGDCFYSSVSVTLFGDNTYVEILRLCTVYIMLKYRTAMEELINKNHVAQSLHNIARGVCVSSALFCEAKRLHPALKSTDIWANEITIFSCAAVLGRPIYIYLDMRQSSGSFQNITYTPSELSDKFVGGFLQLAHNSFANNSPIRILLYKYHYSPLLPVTSLSLPFTPTHRTFTSLQMDQRDLTL